MEVKLKHMSMIGPDYDSSFQRTDQPTTCPHCGARTEIIFDLSHIPSRLQIHVCLSQYCLYEFVEFGQDHFT